MTDIQVKYWDLEEKKRHDSAVEGETRRSNMMNEKIAQDSLSEQRRHNVVGESIDVLSLQENIRKNKASESIAREQNQINREGNVIKSRDVAVREYLAPSEYYRNTSQADLNMANVTGTSLNNQYLARTMDDRVNITKQQSKYAGAEHLTTVIGNVTGSVKDVTSAARDVVDAIMSVKTGGISKMVTNNNTTYQWDNNILK